MAYKTAKQTVSISRPGRDPRDRRLLKGITMTRIPAIAVPGAVLSVALIAGCGPAGSSAGSSSSVASANSTSAAGTADAAASCPTSNTRSFAKTRFAGDVGLAIGTFHRYLYKPYRAGSFKKGTNGRIKALLKGGATAALDVKLLHNAEKNIQANPTLCKKLYAPMSQAITKLDSLKTNVIHGNFTDLGAANSLLGGVLSNGNSSGAGIKESTDTSTGDAG